MPAPPRRRSLASARLRARERHVKYRHTRKTCGAGGDFGRILAVVPTTGKRLPTTDGRLARGQRTKLRVLEALLALVEAGDGRPTALAVAQRADVSLRTVYHHFADVDAVRAAALELKRSRVQVHFGPIEATLPPEERVRLFARQCRRVFEGITPIRRATLADDFASIASVARRKEASEVRRRHLIATFPEYLGAEEERAMLLDAADTATCWLAWNYQRDILQRSANKTEALVASMLDALFAYSRAPVAGYRL